MPPQQAAEFAQQHDEAIKKCLAALLVIDDSTDEHLASEIAQLPFREGGLGLRSASRTYPAAYWASWADTLPEVKARHPQTASLLLDQLKLGADSQAPSIQAATASRRLLMSEGFQQCPTWEQLFEGQRPDPPTSVEPGDWAHGW